MNMQDDSGLTVEWILSRDMTVVVNTQQSLHIAIKQFISAFSAI